MLLMVGKSIREGICQAINIQNIRKIMVSSYLK